MRPQTKKPHWIVFQSEEVFHFVIKLIKINVEYFSILVTYGIHTKF